MLPKSHEDPLPATRDRRRGHPLIQVVFRCPEELVRAAETIGKDKTAGFTRMLDLDRDVRTELGELWRHIDARAGMDGITEGQALGRIVREALAAAKKVKR